MVTIRAALAPLAAVLLLQMPVSAFAQTVDTSADIVPAPAAPGDGVLLYPGGEYARVVHPLLQPGAPYPGSSKGPIHLHMPVKRIVKVAPPDTSDVASTDTSVPPLTDTAPPAETAPPAAAPAAPPPPAPPPPKPAAKKVQVATTPPPKPAHPAQPQKSGLGSGGAVPFSLMPGVPVQSAPEPKIARSEPPPQETMAPAGLPAGLTKQMQIIFAPNVPDPSPDAIDAIKGLGIPLNSALSAGASRIQVVAYGGARGDKGSEARRLSLKRARIIRQLLIDGGVPADRIDVRAMGGATDSNAADRVDIFTKT